MDEDRLLDPTLSLHQFLTDWLEYELRKTGTKPADPKAWEALQRIDQLRQDIQRSLGAEPTHTHDPYGRMPPPPEKKGGA